MTVFPRLLRRFVPAALLASGGGLPGRRSFLAVPLCAGAALLVGGCGFQPVYGGSAGASVREQMAAVEIARIDDRIGQQLRNALEHQLNQGKPVDRKTTTLIVTVQRDETDATMSKEQFATRTSMTVTAHFKLMAGDKLLLSGQSRSSTAFNILDQQYATVVSEKDAQQRGVQQVAEDIARRLSSWFASQPAPARR